MVEALAGISGGERVGIRLSPVSPVNDIGLDSDPEAIYSYAVARLDAFGLAYIHIIEGATQGPREVPGGFDFQILRRFFKGLYIANPDLVERLRIGAGLNVPDRATYFGGRLGGYTGYPVLTAAERGTA